MIALLGGLMAIALIPALAALNSWSLDRKDKREREKELERRRKAGEPEVQLEDFRWYKDGELTNFK